MKYLLEVGYGLSIFINTIFRGSCKDTISNRLRKTKLKHANLIPWRKPVSKTLAWTLDTVVPDHLEPKD